MQNDFKLFLKDQGMTAKAFQERVGKLSTSYGARLSKDGPDPLESLAMAAIAAGLPAWKPENAKLYETVGVVADHIKSLEGEK